MLIDYNVLPIYIITGLTREPDRAQENPRGLAKLAKGVS